VYNLSLCRLTQLNILCLKLTAGVSMARTVVQTYMGTDLTKLSVLLFAHLILGSKIPLPSPPQQMPKTDEVYHRIDDRVVKKMLEQTLVPFFNDVLLDKDYPPLEYVGKEFYRISFELLLRANWSGDVPYRFFPFSFVPSTLPQLHSQGASQRRLMSNVYRNDIVQGKLESAIVSLFKDVLLKTDFPPFKPLGEEFLQLAVCLLRFYNGRVGDGALRSYLIIPFPSGDTYISVGLPPLLNVQTILDLRRNEVFGYFYYYHPSSETPNTVEKARIAVANAIGVILELWI
jgi:hypothetical protein